MILQSVADAGDFVDKELGVRSQVQMKKKREKKVGKDDVEQIKSCIFADAKLTKMVDGVNNDKPKSR